jgi:hypothetical protein
MSALADLDSLYEAFCGTLPTRLIEPGRTLAHTLGLAPAGVPWAQVFGHEVTLTAPALIAEAMPSVPGAVVQQAVLAHMLAVIEAFGTDRLEDGQVARTAELEDVLSHARQVRDEALRRVAPAVNDPRADPRWADDETLRSITLERTLLVGGGTAGFALYEAISRGKQSVGFPASIALAHAAGWGAREISALNQLLEAIWVGLQFHDDVIDWEDDHARSGAWAVALARETQPVAGPFHPEPKQLVFSSGVLARMLWKSRRKFRIASRLALALGARRLSAWAAGREHYTQGLARCEERHAGYAIRAHALGPWARELLA